jgi:hypothetical protein
MVSRDREARLSGGSGSGSETTIDSIEAKDEKIPKDLAALRILSVISAVLLLLTLWNWSNLGGGGSSETDRFAESRTVALETDLVMSVGAPATGILSYGFDSPETDGTWIVARRARLLFQVDAGDPARLTLVFYPFLAGDIATRDIEVRSSVQVVSESLGDGLTSVVIALDGEREQAVDISCPTVDSPLDLGVGSDERTLCAKLISLRIEAD